MKKIIIAAFFTLCSISSFASINEFFECLLEQSVGTKDYTSVYSNKTESGLRVVNILKLYGIVIASADGDDSMENKIIKDVIKEIQIAKGLDKIGFRKSYEDKIDWGIITATHKIYKKYYKLDENYIMELNSITYKTPSFKTLESIRELYEKEKINYEKSHIAKLKEIENEKSKYKASTISKLRRAYKSNGAE